MKADAGLMWRERGEMCRGESHQSVVAVGSERVLRFLLVYKSRHLQRHMHARKRDHHARPGPLHRAGIMSRDQRWSAGKLERCPSMLKRVNTASFCNASSAHEHSTPTPPRCSSGTSQGTLSRQANQTGLWAALAIWCLSKLLVNAPCRLLRHLPRAGSRYSTVE